MKSNVHLLSIFGMISGKISLLYQPHETQGLLEPNLSTELQWMIICTLLKGIWCEPPIHLLTTPFRWMRLSKVLALTSIYLGSIGKRSYKKKI